MRYGREENVVCRDLAACEPVRPQDPQEPMADIMQCAAAAGRDVAVMVEKIGEHLFGSGPNVLGEQKMSPGCFRDELQVHRACLVRTGEALAKICSMLGI